MSIRVTIYNEYVHEKTDADVGAIYPEGMHKAIAAGLAARGEDFTFQFATLEMPEHGLTEEVLQNTDVLIWWGHLRHGDVADEVANRVVSHVHRGMGFVALHSAHASKPFTRLIGTPGNLSWRELAENGRVWNVNPTHEIMAGFGDYFDLPAEEVYSEPFGIPEPADLLAITWWKGGEILRGAFTLRRVYGKIVYFHAGHESFPTYYNENVLRFIGNAIRWAYPARARMASIPFPETIPVEPDVREALMPGYVAGNPRPHYPKPHKWTSTRTDAEE